MYTNKKTIFKQGGKLRQYQQGGSFGVGQGLQMLGGVASLFPGAGSIIGGGLGILGSIITANQEIPVEKETVLSTTGAKQSDPYRVMRKGGKLPATLGGAPFEPLPMGAVKTLGKSHANGGTPVDTNSDGQADVELEKGEIVVDGYVIRKSLSKDLEKKLKSRRYSDYEKRRIINEYIQKNENLRTKENDMKKGPKPKYQLGGPFDDIEDPIPSYVNEDSLLNQPLAGDPLGDYMLNFSRIKNNIGSTNKTQFGNFKPFNTPLTAEQAASANRGVGVQMPNTNSSMQGVGLRMPNAPELNFVGSATLDLFNNQNKVTPPPASAFNMGNAAQLIGGLVPAVYNTIKGSQPAQRIKAVYNPNEGKVMSRLNKARINPQAMYNRNQAAYEDVVQSTNNLVNNTGVRLRNIQSAANQRAQQDNIASLSAQQANAQLDLNAAQVLNTLGQQRAQANQLQQQLQLQTDATKDLYQSTAATQFGQAFANAGLFANADLTNQYYSKILGDGYGYYNYNQKFLNNPYLNAPIFGGNKTDKG